MDAKPILLVAALLLAGCASHTPAATTAPAATSEQVRNPDGLVVVPKVDLVSSFHLMAAPRVQTQAPTGDHAEQTLVNKYYGDTSTTPSSTWSYVAKNAGVIDTGSLHIFLRATKAVLLLTKTGAQDSCSFDLIIQVKHKSATSDFNSVSCVDAQAGLVQPGDLELTMPIAWHGGKPAPVEAGDTVELQFYVNYVDPTGDGLFVLSGSKDKDSVAELPDLHEPVAGVTGLLTK